MHTSTTASGRRDAHAEARDEFREFALGEIAPQADQRHREQRTPPEVIALVAERGYLGLSVHAEYGGGGRDAMTVGLLAAELGRACSSVRSLLTVHSMVAHAIQRWGSRDQKERWLPRMARGETVGALAVSEPEVGSDASSVRTRMVREDGGWVVDGHKKWITYGAVADIFLVIGAGEDGPTALLVERETPGVSTGLITDLVGIRASMTANVRFSGCRVPDTALLGRSGLGVSHVAGAALDLGRYTVAWGCVGILDACLDASVSYAREREQFGRPIRDHQLVRGLISDMYTESRAARLLCAEAGRLRDERSPSAVAAASTAKYFASTAAMRAATGAVQLHGANGCGPEYPVQRYLGDAKVMEIIEGSSQLHQTGLADYAFQESALARSPRAA